MKRHKSIMWLAILGFSWLALPAFTLAGAEGARQQSGAGLPISQGSPSQSSPSTKQSETKNEQAFLVPVYRPPLRAAPEGRVAGGSRSPADDMPMLYFLAPDHVGLTTKEQPVLNWFISELKRYPLEFSIVEVSTHEPIVEVRLKPPKQPGIQSFRLADYGVRLKVGVFYRCFVRMVPDPGVPSRDVVSFGDIRRVELEETLRVLLKEIPKTNHVLLYAKEGFWYDALAAVSDSINVSPKETLFREQRASLMMQAGLTNVAEFEFKQCGFRLRK